MITEIIMKNIKGQDTGQPLTGRDIICGINGSGKTTRAQAVGISLLGYAPGNGKLPEETYKLCSGSKMTVGLKTDCFEFSRAFTRKDTSISQDITVFPPNGEKTAKQKKERILSEVGNLPVMLDFNEFLSLSDSRRREFFYGLAGINAEEWSKDGVYSKLMDTLITPEMEEDDPDMTSDLKDFILAVMDEYNPEDMQQSIERMADFAKVKLSHWKEQKQKADNTAQKISEYKNELQVTDRNLEKNKAELEGLQTELITVSNIIAINKEKQKTESARTARIETLKSEIEAIKAEKPPRSEAEIQDSMRSLNAQIKKVPDSKIRIEMLRKTIEGCKEVNEENETLIKSYNKKISEAQTNSNTYRKLLDMIGQSRGRCVMNGQIKCEKNFDKFIAHAEEQIEAANNVIAENDLSIGRVEKVIAQHKEKITKAESEINRLMDDEISARRYNDEINKMIQHLNQTLITIKGFDNLKVEKIRTRQEELNRLALAVDSDIRDVSPEITRKAEIEPRIIELKALIEEQTKTRIRILDFKNSVIDSKEAETNVECWKMITKALGSSGIQGEIVKSILGPIRNTIQEKLDAIGVDEEFFFETSSDKGKEVFQFGWRVSPNEKYNFDALSTGEQMLLLIALVTTIIERNNPPLKILMIDNIENLDKENFCKVVTGMDKVAQNLDNVIFLGVIEPDPADCPGWTIWNLSGDEKAVAV